MSSVLQNLVNQPYRHGFVTDIEAETAPKGLTEDTIRLISHKKDEPQWLLDFRLKAFRHWQTMAEPTWPNVKYPRIDFQDIIYYAAPKPKPKLPLTWWPWKVSPTPGRYQAPGGKGAQPQWLPLYLQHTQDGPQTLSGAQHQPRRWCWNQRP